MIVVKERTRPLRIAQLEALLRRIPNQHEKVPTIKKELVRRKVGYQGEQSLNYYFRFLNDPQLFLLHDLRLLGTNRSYFQIDTLLVSKSFIAILEIKNYTGSIYFDPDTYQVYRTSATHDDEILTNPLLQIQAQKLQLRDWLTAHNWPLLPIAKLVVFSDPSTKIVSTPTNLQLLKQVVTAPALLSKLESLQSTYSKDYLTDSGLEKLVQQLVHKHVPPACSDVLHDYRISAGTIISGVYCPSCQRPTLTRGVVVGKWFCPDCMIASKHAHLSALEDYFLLLNHRVSTGEIHAFLQTSNRQQAYDLVNKLPLARVGQFRARRYELMYPLHIP